MAKESVKITRSDFYYKEINHLSESLAVLKNPQRWFWGREYETPKGKVPDSHQFDVPEYERKALIKIVENKLDDALEEQRNPFIKALRKI
jgi:hypothetical protein